MEIKIYKSEIKISIRHAQTRAALAVNAEMILLYWKTCKMIAERQTLEGWSSKVIPRLALDLKNEFSELKGYSERNLGYMLRFAIEYPDESILQQAVAKLPRGHNILLIEKIKDIDYGPYSVQLTHVFSYLNGVYLKGMEQNEIKPFEPLFLNYEKYSEIEQYVEKELKPEQRRRLTNVLNLIKGFQSTYALELLASVDFVKKDNKIINVEEIKQKIASWNKRKANLFESKHIDIAYKRLQDYALSIA